MPLDIAKSYYLRWECYWENFLTKNKHESWNDASERKMSIGLFYLKVFFY